jgi:hypothetical protein
VKIVLTTQTVIRQVMEAGPDKSYKGVWDEDLSEDRWHAGVIYIDRRLPADERWDTFWHELAHAITDISSWDRELRARGLVR